MLAEPSKATPLIVLGVCNVDAVVAFPVNAPIKVEVVNEPDDGLNVILLDEVFKL